MRELCKIMLYAKQRSVPVSKLGSWSTPTSGSWKFHTDRAMNGVSQVTSADGVIRNDVGVWCKRYSRSLGHGSLIPAELCAIYDGLQLAWDNDIRSLEVESDNQAVVFIINSDRDVGSCFSLVCDTKTRISRGYFDCRLSDKLIVRLGFMYIFA